MRYLIFVFIVFLLASCEGLEDNSGKSGYLENWAVDTAYMTGTSIVEDAFLVVTDPI
jgi:hypothetical protein